VRGAEGPVGTTLGSPRQSRSFILAFPTQPVAGQVDRDEELVFYSPYLYWNESSELALVLRGRFLEPERTGLGRRVTIDRVLSPSLYRYIGKNPDDFDESARALMVERLTPFLADGESGVSLKMRLEGQGGSAVMTLPRTGAGGNFSVNTTAVAGTSIKEIVGNAKDLQIELVLPATDTRKFTSKPRVPPRDSPLLVISDLDDTVRIAEVLDRPRLIERVFLRQYEAVPGVAATYRRLAELGGEFHFVSGSPWQLLGVIEGFLARESFPPAVMHCRQLSWDFWNSDAVHTKEFKIGVISGLIRQFRSGKVLLIGDDGEHDPEVYNEICRRHPDRIAGIWIRHVTPAATDERLATARRQLGSGRVVLFEDADELTNLVDQLTR
jgi:hypothetical protein